MALLPLRLAAAVSNRATEPYQIFSAHPEAIYNDKPALHPNIRMKYYFESIHFNQHTGALMLDRLMSRTTTESPDFGKQLTADTNETTLQEIREQQRRFRQQHPDYCTELHAIMADR